jgi:hypothetical protein
LTNNKARLAVLWKILFFNLAWEILVVKIYGKGKCSCKTEIIGEGII